MLHTDSTKYSTYGMAFAFKFFTKPYNVFFFFLSGRRGFESGPKGCSGHYKIVRIRSYPQSCLLILFRALRESGWHSTGLQQKYEDLDPDPRLKIPRIRYPTQRNTGSARAKNSQLSDFSESQIGTEAHNAENIGDLIILKSQKGTGSVKTYAQIFDPVWSGVSTASHHSEK
jgi:hypothetical protein